MDFNDIARLLREGISADEIAEAFSEVLNDEIATYEEELAAEANTQVIVDPREYDYDNWDFHDFCELLSLAWNKAVISYGEDHNIPDNQVEAMLTTSDEAEQIVALNIKYFTSPITQALMRDLPKLMDELLNLKDNLKELPKRRCECNHRTPSERSRKEFDEFEEALKEFLNHKV